MDCIFCNIIEKKSPAEILFENEKVISFLDINPMNYGHALVIPKVHCKDFLEVPFEYYSELLSVMNLVGNKIIKSLAPDGFNIVANNGLAAGQSVFHFHFHIIPRYNDDQFKFKLKLKKYEGEEMKNYAEKIRLIE